MDEWVQVDVENNFERVYINSVFAGLVELGENGINALLSHLVWRSSQTLEEGIVVDITVLLGVKVV